MHPPTLASKGFITHRIAVGEKLSILYLSHADRSPTSIIASLPLFLPVQVGQSEHVLQLGHELLLTRELEGSAEVKGDVLLSMALACCNMAAEALELENQVGGAG